MQRRHSERTSGSKGREKPDRARDAESERARGGKPRSSSRLDEGRDRTSLIESGEPGGGPKVENV
jgi:hypothetical protein